MSDTKETLAALEERVRALEETVARLTAPSGDEDTCPDMVTIKYDCGDYYTDKTEKETMPTLAQRFLELVNPTIEVTLAKHNYNTVVFNDMLSQEKSPSWAHYYPAHEWADEGSGRWHDAIFECANHGTEAWNYYCANQDKDNVDGRTLEIYRGKIEETKE